MERTAARITDHDGGHLYRRAVGSRDYLAPCRCEAFVDETGDHVSVEFIGVHEHVLYDAVWRVGEQRQRTALFPTEAQFSRGRHQEAGGTCVVDRRVSQD